MAADIAAAMNAASRALKTSTTKALRDAGDTAVRNAPKVKFRNMGGASTGAKANATADDVTVTPTGPVGILEPGARPHIITSRRRGGAMPVGGGVWRHGPFRHPGTSNTHKWTKAQEKTFRQVEQDFPETVGDAVGSAFGD